MLNVTDCIGMGVIVFYTTVGLCCLDSIFIDDHGPTYDAFGYAALISSLFVIVVGALVFALDTYGSRNASIIEHAVSPRETRASLW